MGVGENRLELRSIATQGNLYRRMIEEIQDYAIIVLDKNGFIQNWNKGAEKIKQYSEQEIIGKHFSIFYLPEDFKDNLPQRLLKRAEDTGVASQEGWRKRKDGSRFWGSITITAIHDENKNVIGFCKVTRDLTDRKEAEDNLRISEERYHQMIAEVQDYAIILLSVDGVIENWNAGAEKIKGYSSEEIIGRSFQIFYTSEDREKGLPWHLLSTAKEAGRAVHEGWRVRKNGSKFWGSITITALHNKSGTVIGFSKVTRDLTQQKIAEEKLAEYTAELEIQNSELEQFAYVASHDLQEPLRKIQTFSDLIKENFDDREFAEKYLNKLDLSAKRMSELVRSLLNYSRLSKDKPDVTEVDLNAVLREVKLDFELLIEEKRATIANEPLPKVQGNHMQLGQLFSNLISNSLKFSKEAPCITIDSKIVERSQITNAPKNLTNGVYCLIQFKDNGIGFEKQYRDKIFSLFQRLHGKQHYAGTGIGLALCKKIVENHNGFISAEGELGKGAVFYVYLPVVDLR
ncbi:sensor histidine kinase [Segetibacter aerophilus]|uniref:histidine kinase n=1 Tax=Segetibacter aerophilus TaxID=670293 RepID=A0A512B8H8_9BACT|nr:PAS domain-containing sensor histidine kinase [Segetibacter aerophilus]GEO08253.1 histidine kinase [Segetibacter aerophilus]